MISLSSLKVSLRREVCKQRIAWGVVSFGGVCHCIINGHKRGYQEHRLLILTILGRNLNEHIILVLNLVANNGDYMSLITLQSLLKCRGEIHYLVRHTRYNAT